MAFQAKFVGICHCGCGETVGRDEWVTYNAENLVVIEGHEFRTRARENPICPKCYLAHAGECF